MIEAAVARAPACQRGALPAIAERLQSLDAAAQVALLLAEDTAAAMHAVDDRPFAAEHAPAVRARCRAPAGRLRQLVRAVSALATGRSGAARHVRRRDRAPAGNPRHGLRRAVLPADPSDRHDQPQGPQQRAARRAGRRRQPLCDRRRRRAGTTRSIRSSARWTTSARWSRRRSEQRAGDRARLRHPVLARPSLAARAPGLVPLAARRLDPLRREPAEEVRGHRQSSISTPRARCRRCGSRCATSCSSGSTRACASSASTIRTPSRCRSGNG